jgi:hypothetical protein
MAWTEQDYQEIVARLKTESQGVGDVPNAETLTGISSLPAYQEKDGEDIIVSAPLELLAAPALDAADKANTAAAKAESNATAAQTAANSANEKAGLAAQAASDANAAKEGAETATQSANNAASNAEEKAAAANTAAQDAEKVANNPTYIGKDHYVYVYNKETESFDKTDIYCKGEPGSSFRVAGEYATLEALKSAVPDGSAVDGFMAVGTEAPYDYYAWVNGEWVSQGKIAGGNVINFPSTLLNLTSGSESSEILSVFGGLDALRATIAKLRSDNCIIVCGNKNGNYTYVFDDYHVNYTDENNFKLSLFDISGKSSINVDFLYMIVALVDGVAEIASKKKHSLVKDSDVLTKTNTSSFTPTGDYQPATKKYVDDSISTARSVGYMMQLTEIDASGLDEDTWYPVTISAGERMNIRVEVLVSLDSGTKPSWSTHERGFSTRKIWEFAPSVWGVNRDSNITIYLSDFVHADIDPVRGLGNLSQFDSCYVFVRGGGKYHFYASHNAYVTLRTDTYKPEGGTQSVSPTIETPAEIVADIATKKYVKTTHYGKTIVVSDISKILYSIELNGADAEQRIVDLFGSIDNFKNVVADILANHTRYYFHINNNLNNNCIELGCVNAWRANDSTSYELHFVITYFGNNPVKMFTNRISIISNDDNRESKVIIASLVNSDNINTLTKKTSAEYKGIGSKDKETMYAITDA